MDTTTGRRRRRLYCYLPILALLAIGACDNRTAPTENDLPTRTFRMGFSDIPPRFDFREVIKVVDMWSRRADAAIMNFAPPWDSLLAGVPPETLVVRNRLGMANYYRAKGHELWVYIDPANGLDRAGEADELVDAGRSITEPSVQQIFRRYAVVVDSVVRPEHLGLALETNLIRGLSPPPLYAAIRQVANDAAADVRAVDGKVKLSVSVQVEWAWGRLGNPNPYEGIDQDFIDFPFIDELGLSSYPYLTVFDTPEEIPLDYYSWLIEGRAIPVMITEGGWSSATMPGTRPTSAAEQRRYIGRHRELLLEVGATAVFQLMFTDLAVDSTSRVWGVSRLGLVDVNLNPKPALAAWDALFAHRYEP